MPSPVIDVHTHCLTEAWFELLQRHGGPRYSVKAVSGGMRAIHLDGAPFMTPVPAMFDYDLRLRTMNDVGVDVGVVSLTCPNCYLGRTGSEPRGGAHHELTTWRRRAPRTRTGCAGSPRSPGSIRSERSGARARGLPPAHRA
jgi:hypothetical protein